MATEILWTDSPALNELIAAPGALKGAVNNQIVAAAICTNGAYKKKWGKVLLDLHDFTGVPAWDAEIEVHVVYALEGEVNNTILYADGSDGTATTPRLGDHSRVDRIRVAAVDARQRLQSRTFPVDPFDFLVLFVLRLGTGVGIADTAGSYAKIALLSDTIQDAPAP